MPSDAKSRQKTIDSVIGFLNLHRLDPTPDNYRLAYLYETAACPAISQAIALLTDGGIRLREQDVTTILEANADGMTTTDPDESARASLRRQAMRLSEITQDTASATSALNRDLEQGIADLDNDPTGATLRAAVTIMASRAKAAEQRLENASREMHELRQDLESARNDASKDALTGLANRRAFEKALAECGSAERTVAFIDVDHFKSVNDRFGHAVGDRVLKVVADTISEACSPHLVARWGGEEFVVLFKNSEVKSALPLIDHARRKMEKRKFRLRENDEPLGAITFSAGMASTADPEGDASMIAQADARLYAAKEAGRNRIAGPEA